MPNGADRPRSLQSGPLFDVIAKAGRQLMKGISRLAAPQRLDIWFWIQSEISISTHRLARWILTGAGNS